MFTVETKSQISLGLLVLLFLISPFYTHPNIGGLGLAIPFNNAVWFVALIMTCLISMFSVLSRKINFNLAFLFCLIFPVIVILEGIFSDVPHADVWLFRQLYIIGGYAFLFALFQTNLTTKNIDYLLYCTVLATLLHALVGIVQIADVAVLESWLPLSQESLPIGIFQQVNVQASYLSTGLVIILYLINRPSFIAAGAFSRWLFVFTFGFSVYVIVSSGSRVGILSLILASSLMLICRRNQLLRHKKLLFALIGVSLVGALAGQSGFFRALDKTEKMTTGEYASARQTMYAVAIDLIENKPLLGYGIGSFPRVWADQTEIFSIKYPNATIPQLTSTHPHNEALLWMIEGGFVALTGLLVIFITICYSLYQCGCSRGGAYVALLLPITLHTQLELPFYISSVHWFLWLFLIFIVFRHGLKTINLNISQSANYFIQLTILVLGIAGAATLVHAEKAQNVIFEYMYREGENLQVALDDFYFNSFAEKLMMQSLLYNAITHDNKAAIPHFIEWAEDTIQSSPELGMFILLSDAYNFIGDEANHCRVAQRGITIYTENERLKNLLGSCPGKVRNKF